MNQSEKSQDIATKASENEDPHRASNKNEWKYVLTTCTQISTS